MSEKTGGPDRPVSENPSFGDLFYRDLLKAEKIVRVAVTGDLLVARLELCLIDTSVFCWRPDTLWRKGSIIIMRKSPAASCRRTSNPILEEA